MSARTSVVDVHFCGQGEALAGQVAVADLAVFRRDVAKSEGILSFDIVPVRFGGKPAVQVSLRGRVWHTCQRCLGDFEAELAAQRVLVFALPPADLEDEGEATDFVGADARFEALALVEEEALLCLPMVPRHPAGECPAEVVAGRQGGRSGGFDDREATEEH